ncbi:MAG: DUF362 domain-containing protein [Planctomycetes bacterium]|nr:DUF362 domain-containing protein [Planctomycetota bacterium]
MRVDRRTFFRRVGAAGAVAAAGAGGAIWMHLRPDGLREPDPVRIDPARFDVAEAPDRPKFAIANGKALEAGGSMASHPETILRMAEAAVGALGGIERFVQKGDVVLIKPNVGFARPPHIGATAHPDVVAAFVRLAKAAGAEEVIVTDYPMDKPVEACFRVAGIADAVARAGGTIAYAREDLFEKVAMPDGVLALQPWPMWYRPLARANKVIGIAPVKHHVQSGATLTMKNWYGLLGGTRSQFHQDIHRVIHDLALLMSATRPLLVLDATRILVRNGPTGGRASDVEVRNQIIAGTDPVAMDAYGATLLGQDPARIGYLEYGRASGLGERDWKSLRPPEITI